MVKLRSLFQDFCWLLGTLWTRLFHLQLFNFFHVEATAMHDCDRLLNPEMSIMLSLDCAWGKIVVNDFGTGPCNYIYKTTWYEDQKPENLSDTSVPLIDLRIYIPVRCADCRICILIGRKTDAKPLTKTLSFDNISGPQVYTISVPIADLVEAFPIPFSKE